MFFIQKNTLSSSPICPIAALTRPPSILCPHMQPAIALHRPDTNLAGRGHEHRRYEGCRNGQNFYAVSLTGDHQVSSLQSTERGSGGGYAGRPYCGAGGSLGQRMLSRINLAVLQASCEVRRSMDTDVDRFYYGHFFLFGGN